MKRVGWWTLLLVGIGAAIYGYMEFTRTRKDLRDITPKFSTTATALIHEFAADELTANKKYNGLNVVLAIRGRVTEIECDERDNYTISLGDTASTSTVRCSMDTTGNGNVGRLVKGQDVTVKGYFTGYRPDELGLGADVQMHLCILN